MIPNFIDQTTSNKNPPPKNICIITFQSKAIVYIKLSKILNKPDVIAQLLRVLQNKEHRLVINHKLTNTIRIKILNYKDTVNLKYVEDEIYFNLNIDSCECEDSPFIHHHHEYIITGDLRIVGNSRLRKLLTKAPNYGEPSSTNFNKAFAGIATGLNNGIENLASRTRFNVSNFVQWKK